MDARPQWLADAHATLDAAVAAAYGWPTDITDDHALRELLALNSRLPLNGLQGLNMAIPDYQFRRFSASLFQEPPRTTRRPGAGQAPGTGCPRGANHPPRKIARRSRHVSACAACATQARTRCSTAPRVTVPARQRSRSPRRRLRNRRTFASGSRRLPRRRRGRGGGRCWRPS